MRYNETPNAMEPHQYVIDESFRRTKNNRLLNDEGTGPNPALSERSDRALAFIADAVHTHAQHLSPEQIELAVRWLKSWKLRDALPANINDYEASKAFEQELDTLRNSPEQLKLQRAAARHGTWSRVWGALCAAALATMVGMAIAGGAGAVAWCIAVAVLIGSLIQSERSLVRALVTAKEQDRKYALGSLRAAKTVTELINAGLCSYIPGVLHEGQSYDEKYAKSQMFKERERLADALYLDPDRYLDPYSFRDVAVRDGHDSSTLGHV